MPPCPHVSRSPVRTSTASGALRARSSPRRTRSMPISRGVVGGADTLVPDGDAVLVDAVLGTPEPGGAGEERGVRAGVTDGEVLRAQRAPGGGAAAEGPGDLDL